MENPTYPDEDEGPRILGATFTVTVAAFLTLLIRLYVRVRMLRAVGWDDYTMCLTMIVSVTGQAFIIPQVRYGAGRHLGHVPETDYELGVKLNFITQPIYLWALFLVKMSVGFFLLRIAATGGIRRAIMAVMVIMSAYTLACFCTHVLQCTNLTVMWDKTAQGACWDTKTLLALAYTNVSMNIVTDLLFCIVIPVPMLWNLQMGRRQKASVIAILSLGLFATAAACVRLYFLRFYGRDPDILWNSRSITIWTVAECNVGIVAGNLPCFKPLFRSVLGATKGSWTGHRSNTVGTGCGKAGDNYNIPFGGEAMQLKSTVTASKGFKPDDVSEIGSTESQEAFAKYGGITRTTEVNVVGSTSANDDDIDKSRSTR